MSLLRLFRFSALILSIAFSTAALRAQAASFVNAVSTFATGFNQPFGIALDNQGNLYVTDSGNNRVVKITPDGAQSVLNTGGLLNLTPWSGIATDPAGNVFIAGMDTNWSGVVVKVAADGNASAISAGSITFFAPAGIAVDTSGDIFVSDSAMEGRIVEIASSGEASIINTSGMGLSYCNGLAVDKAGNLYVADSPNNRIVKITANGAWSQVNTGSYTLNAPQGVSVDPAGNLYIADTYNGSVKEVATDGSVSVVNSTLLSGDSFDTFGVAAAEKGVFYMLEDIHSSTPETYSVVKVQSDPDFGEENVCPAGTASPSPCSKSLTLQFRFDGDATLRIPLLTNTDFTTLSGNDCSGTFHNGEACRLNVQFAPSFAGARKGAVELADNNGNTLSTAYVHGVGFAPAAGFSPGATSPISTGSQTLAGPSSVAVDEHGNTYVADRTNHQVLQITSGSASALNTGTLNQPSALALDGAGALYIADSGLSRILKVSSTGSVSTVTTGAITLTQPEGVAVDGAGTLYISDAGNNHIVKVLQNGSSSIVSTPGLNLLQPHGVFIDGQGALYIADTGNSRIIKVSSDGSASIVSTGDITLQQPVSITADASGTLYVADASSAQIVQLSPTGTVSTITTGKYALQQPSSVAVDAHGNLFITDAGSGQLLFVDRVTPPSLSFPSTAAGAVSAAQSVALTNLGNANLVFPAPPTGTNPSLAANFVANGTNSCPTLSAGASCSLNISFAPASIGAMSGTLVFTDNDGNASNPYATQTVQLNGTAAQGTTSLTLVSSINPSQYGDAVTLTAALSTSGSAITTGSISFYDGSAALGTANLNTSGQASITTSNLSVGTHNLTAKYAGSADYLASVSPVLAQIVNQNTIAITWTPTSTIQYGTSLANVLNATASNHGTAASGTFSYTAQFADGTVSAVNAATMLPAGTYTIIAAFTPADTTNNAITKKTATLTVTKAPLSVVANNATRTYGSPNPAFTGTMTGVIANDSLTETFSTTATQSSNVATYAIIPGVTGASLANYAVTAHNGLLTINKAGTTVTLTTSNANPTNGDSVTWTAIVSSNTSFVPAGAVQFLDSSTVLGTSPVNGQGTATFTTTMLTAGSHTIVAIYTGDQNFSQSQNAVSEQVKGPSFSLALDTAQLTLKPGQSGNIKATLNAEAGFQGTVKLSCSGLPIGASCSFSPASLTASKSNTALSSTLTIRTTGLDLSNTAQAKKPSFGNGAMLAGFWFLPSTLLGGWLLWQRRRLRAATGNVLLLLVLLGCCAAGVMGCGITPEPGYTGTTTITVNAAPHDGDVQSATFVLQVEP
ncbi:MAG TPA: Ig-like domain repeat protein [Alloacidobacterium sp.]|nr:Ig-like domain repeat protein [Alloacidobacterium sp.]